jgi:hypothetical protein
MAAINRQYDSERRAFTELTFNGDGPFAIFLVSPVSCRPGEFARQLDILLASY